MLSNRTAVCTICSCNYLPYARTLMASLARVHPEWDRYVLFVDRIGNLFVRSEEGFECVEVREIPIPDVRQLLFKYTILEANTAVKPSLLEWLLERKGYDRAVYIDPDIVVYDRLAEMEEAMDAGAAICLTPHLTAPLFDDCRPSEIDIMQAGAYNLGFIGVEKQPATMDFLTWWQRRMDEHCVVDLEAGLFVDQKWIDLAPGMFGDTAILRHPGYNVAYWNLAHRKVEKQPDGGFRVNGERLVFFHYSGIDPTNPEPVSKHQDRLRLDDLGDAKELVYDYARNVLGNGHAECRTWPYAFDALADGGRISDPVRRCYRDHEPLQERGGADPFLNLSAHDFNAVWPSDEAPEPPVTLLARSVWEMRPDLQRAFPDIENGNRADFASWFVHAGAAEHALPACFVEPMRQSLGVETEPVRRRHAARLAARFPRVAGRVPQRLRRMLAGPTAGASGDALGNEIASASTHCCEERDMIFERTRTRAPVEFFGFWPAGNDELAWMGERGSLRLVDGAGGLVTIRGEYAPDMIEKAHGSPELILRVCVDDRPIGEVVLDQPGEFECSVALPDSTTVQQSLILEASRSFRPVDIGLNQDPRALTCRIRSVLLDGAALLDFSRAGSPYVPQRLDLPQVLGMNVVGYVRSELGVGESSRLCASACEAAGIPYAVGDFSVGSASRARDERLASRIGGECPHPVNVVHVNADQVPVVYSFFGKEFFEGRYNIGYWHWELPEFPEEWLSSFLPFNEIWVPTRFVADAVGARSPIPVQLMPHGLSFSVPEGASREHFGLPKGDFLFLLVYDMRSAQARKNPQGAIEAFRRAFPDPDGVGLVIKTMNAEAHPREFEELEGILAETPGSMLINRVLAREETFALESVCDAFVSLHRSEGFGLGLAESMLLGKPVVATDWSGNTDFMNEHNSCPVRAGMTQVAETTGPYRAGQTWADPDLDHAAWLMRKLVNEPAWGRQVGEAGRATIERDFSPAAAGSRYRRRLDLIRKLL